MHSMFTNLRRQMRHIFKKKSRPDSHFTLNSSYMSEAQKQRRRSSSLRAATRRRSSVWESTVFASWSSKESNEPGVRCNSLCKNGTIIPGTGYHATIWESFKNGLAVSRYRNCLGRRVGDDYKWWSYEEVAKSVESLAWAITWKTRLRRQDCVGIYSKSQPLWLIAAYACAARSLIVVPIYDTLGADRCTHIINQTSITVIFVDTADAASRLVSRSTLMPLVTSIVILNNAGLDAELCSAAMKANVTVWNLVEFSAPDITDNDETVTCFDPPTETDICYVLFTSGTDGPPKGVMLTHRAVVSNMISVDVFTKSIERPGMKFSEADVCLMFLPLAHGYGLLIANWFLYRGASIGFYGGDVKRLMEDASVLHPTFLPLVPRLMNKIYAKTVKHFSHSAIKSKLFWHAFDQKKELLQRGIIARDTVWDQMIFRKLQNFIGGRVWLASVGSAPVTAEVLQFWQIAFGCLVVEGYGQTECNAVTTLAIGTNRGNVGHPVQCNLVKLVDVPEAGYFRSNGQGEVCVKGSNVMIGYFKEPEKTAEVLDEDGWLHTGDIGEFLPNGSLRIIDRKKHIFKLAQGEYISPEKIENVYAMCPLVSQIFVDGISSEWYTVAIVVPENSAVEEYANQLHLDPKMLLWDPNDARTIAFTKYVLREMRAVGKANHLNSLEQVRSIYLTKEAFTAENGLATPTMKNRRNELRLHFRAKLDALYKTGPMVDDINKF